MSGYNIILALREGQLTNARAAIHNQMNESRDDLIEGGKRYIAEALITESDDSYENDQESEDEGDEYEDEEDSLDEAKIITKVNSAGEKTKRKKAPEGYKYVDGKLTKIGAIEAKNRSKGAKRGNKKKEGQRNTIKRKTAKAMKKRSSMGL